MILTGKFLLATPSLNYTEFEKSVIYLLEHSEKNGSMGVIINKTMDYPLKKIFKKLKLNTKNIKNSYYNKNIVFDGGPVNPENGFVAHQHQKNSPINKWEQTILNQKQGVNVTISQDIIAAIANNNGPEKYMIILGHTKWEPGQLEEEIHENNWLVASPPESILFDLPIQKRFDETLLSLGIKCSSKLSYELGHA